MSEQQGADLIAAVGDLGAKLDTVGLWLQSLNAAVNWCFWVLLAVLFFQIIGALLQRANR